MSRRSTWTFLKFPLVSMKSQTDQIKNERKYIHSHNCFFVFFPLLHWSRCLSWSALKRLTSGASEWPSTTSTHARLWKRPCPGWSIILCFPTSAAWWQPVKSETQNSSSSGIYPSGCVVCALTLIWSPPGFSWIWRGDWERVCWSRRSETSCCGTVQSFADSTCRMWPTWCTRRHLSASCC